MEKLTAELGLAASGWRGKVVEKDDSRQQVLMYEIPFNWCA